MYPVQGFQIVLWAPLAANNCTTSSKARISSTDTDNREKRVRFEVGRTKVRAGLGRKGQWLKGVGQNRRGRRSQKANHPIGA